MPFCGSSSATRCSASSTSPLTMAVRIIAHAQAASARNLDCFCIVRAAPVYGPTPLTNCRGATATCVVGFFHSCRLAAGGSGRALTGGVDFALRLTAWAVQVHCVTHKWLMSCGEKCSGLQPEPSRCLIKSKFRKITLCYLPLQKLSRTVLLRTCVTKLHCQTISQKHTPVESNGTDISGPLIRLTPERNGVVC